MSVRRYSTIWCDADDCYFWKHLEHSYRRGGRKEAQQDGWRRVNGKDYCPDCAAKRAKGAQGP